MLLKALPFQTPVAGVGRQWTDQDDAQVAMWVSAEYRIPTVPIDSVCRAVESEALHNSYHPVKKYLEGLRWDGTPRLDSWLTRFLGVKKSRYSMAVGAKWMISAVARIYEPGCQADNTLIFEGTQGTGKSTTLETLASQGWHTSDLTDLGSKDSAQQLPGKWILELAELNAMRKSAIEATKAFLTRRVDHYRPSYGRRTIDVKRSCVFAGSTNSARYLQDEENRRFWPIRCTTIDVPALALARDQLWAETLHRYKAKEPWWLDHELTQLAKAEQEERKEEDPWHNHIALFLSRSLVEGYTPLVDGIETDEVISADVVRQVGWSVSEILQYACSVNRERQERSGEMRASKILKDVGWVRKNTWDPKTKLQTWRYKPTS